MSKLTAQKILHVIVRTQVYSTYITMVFFMLTEQISARRCIQEPYLCGQCFPYCGVGYSWWWWWWV